MVKTIEIKEPFLPSTNALGEGPLFDPRNNVLAWLDIVAEKVHWVDYSKAELGSDAIWATHKSVAVGSAIGVIALTPTPLKYIAGVKTGFAYVDLTNAKGDGELVSVEYVQQIHTSEEDLKLKRFNDGWVDPKGRFLAGSMFDFGTPNNKDGKLYRFDAKSSTLDVIAEGLQIPNGIGFSPDNKIMYFIDSLTHYIFKYDYDITTGELANRREFIRVDPGEPDGMTTSRDGHLWVAVFGQSTVLRYTPQGELIEIYKLPAQRITCPAFAGPNFDELIVTTANLVHADEEETEEKKNLINGTNGYARDFGGSIFRIKVDVSGIPSNILSI